MSCFVVHNPTMSKRRPTLFFQIMSEFDHHSHAADAAVPAGLHVQLSKGR
jgi:hypothetical protein